MKASNPSCKQRLKNIQSALQRVSLAESFSRFIHYAFLPNVIEQRVTFGKFVGGYSQQEFRRAGQELSAYRAYSVSDVANVCFAASATDKRQSDRIPRWIVDIFEHTQRMIGESEGEVHQTR